MTDEVVNETPVETTTETDSTPVETQTEEISEETPVDESIDTEKVSKTVPYDRFKEVNDEVKSLKEMVAAMYQKPQEPAQATPELDPDAQAAVDYRISLKANEIIAQQRVAEFQAKHATELKKDPILQATVEAEMRKQNAQGQPILPEKAFEDAKALIETRLKVKQDEAKTEGIKEGQDIAKTKQQLSAVGETGKTVDKPDDQLSAAELAQKYGIPRSAGY